MNTITSQSIKNKTKKQKISIDDEWSSFMSNIHKNEAEDDEILEENNQLNILMSSFDEDEKDIVSANMFQDVDIDVDIENTNERTDIQCQQIPVPTDLYISTKSKIAFLNQTLDLKKIFWGLRVIPYSQPINGIIKKLMKFNSLVKEELEEIKEHLKAEPFYEEQIMTSIDNPSGRIKFKDMRKVSIGLSKKDIMTFRSKKKKAFYNCFVIIIRMKIDDSFKEFHIKCFNTGRLEMPGVQNNESEEKVLEYIKTILQPFVDQPLDYLKKSQTILVNSNFNCGFYINREALCDILKHKYNLHCIFDPCSYPGIQCKFYYNQDLQEQTGCQISSENKELYSNIVEVSFMIFRTGSILIVGMCDDHVLYYIYNFLKKILVDEFIPIHQKVVLPLHDPLSSKKPKIRKRNIVVNI